MISKYAIVRCQVCHRDGSSIGNAVRDGEATQKCDCSDTVDNTYTRTHKTEEMRRETQDNDDGQS